MKDNRPKPWQSSTWTLISDATSPVFSMARDRAAVRSTQILVDQKGKMLGFGKISHDAKGAAKWTHDVNGSLPSGETPMFLGTEVWAPSWNNCVRQNRAPDAFLAIANRNSGINSHTALTSGLDALCIFAVANDLGNAANVKANEAAHALNKSMLADIALKSVRPWGVSSGRGGFTNGIQDLAVAFPFNRPIRDQDEPLELLLRSGWSCLVS